MTMNMLQNREDEHFTKSIQNEVNNLCIQAVALVYFHQPRSAKYTSSRIPHSWIKTAWLCWMCQLSTMQRVVVCWCRSNTSGPWCASPWQVHV